MGAHAGVAAKVLISLRTCGNHIEPLSPIANLSD